MVSRIQTSQQDVRWDSLKDTLLRPRTAHRKARRKCHRGRFENGPRDDGEDDDSTNGVIERRGKSGARSASAMNASPTWSGRANGIVAPPTASNRDGCDGTAVPDEGVRARPARDAVF